MFNYIKNQAIFSGIFTSLVYAVSLVINTPSANAVSVSLSDISCDSLIMLGDVIQNGCSFQMTPNALEEEDTPFELPPGSGQSAPDFNLSGNPALDAPELETGLKLNTGALSPSPFVQLEHGSALQFQVNNESNEPLFITINWTLESTEPNIDYPFIPGLPDDFNSFFVYYDALLKIDENNQIAELARTDSSQTPLTPPVTQPSSSLILVSQGQITFSLAPESSKIIDKIAIAEFNNTSIVSLATLNIEAKPVPEPSTILGTITFMGFLFGFKRRSSRK